MKKYGKYLIAAVAGLVFFAACDNYEADGRSTSRTRREHEQQSIEKHHPTLNRSKGGEGRPAGK